MNEICRVTEETNEYYRTLEIDSEDKEREERLARMYADPYHVEDALCLNSIKYPDHFDLLVSDELEYHKAEFWGWLMADLGEAFKKKDYMKVGMLLAPHFNNHLEKNV